MRLEEVVDGECKRLPTTWMSHANRLYDPPSMSKWTHLHRDWIYLAVIVGVMLAVVVIAGYTWMSSPG